MSRLLVTGADGFVGRHLVRAALAEGRDVVAGIVPGGADPAGWLSAAESPRVEVIHADLLDEQALARLAQVECDAVVHLAAIASGGDARRDPELAMRVNGQATAMLLEALGEAGHAPRFLFISTGEVYGAGHDGPIPESATLAPVSPYGVSKSAAESAVLDLGPAGGIDTIIARPFPHTGPGQDTRFVLPAFAARLRQARKTGERQIAVGNLDVTRDVLDVRDVVQGYLRLLEQGTPGECYNVATGTGQHLEACFRALAAIIGVDAVPVQDPALMRPADIRTLVGDPAKLNAATGWWPTIAFSQTLQDLVDAQAD
jgi:GDP-4-dehydro-6-deoxy-D-mannose reductase